MQSKGSGKIPVFGGVSLLTPAVAAPRLHHESDKSLPIFTLSEDSIKLPPIVLARQGPSETSSPFAFKFSH